MKNAFLFCFFLAARVAFCQEPARELQQQLEAYAEANETVEEDAEWLQLAEELQKHPVSVNDADAAQLSEIRLLTALQVRQLLLYRRQLGPLLSLYELQAVPGWDLSTIRAVLPYLTLEKNTAVNFSWKERLGVGEQNLVARVSQSNRKENYRGSPQHLLLRYRYNFRNITQWGITADKDAGEQFFKGAQRLGFDHYSLYFFSRNLGIIRSLAIGDFTLNMAQGLIHWQGMAFNKSAEVINIKRQSEILRPFSSSGEFYYNRGLGLTIEKGSWSLTGFASLRSLSGNRIKDSLSGEQWISSIQRSGYHRSESEAADKNDLLQYSFGGNISFCKTAFKAGLNLAAYQFSLPLKKAGDPYKRFAIEGKSWCNASFDHSFSFRNLHCFGEFAIDRNLEKAILVGLMISVDRRMDLSFLYRDINKGYQSINGNAFTEGTLPSNEKGYYAGISLRPSDAWTLQVYCDIFFFPWLRYRVDAPSCGKDALIKIEFKPDKQTEIGWRWHRKTTEQNIVAPFFNELQPVSRQTMRFYFTKKIDGQFTLRQRVESSLYNKQGDLQKGWLWLLDILYKPLIKPLSIIARVSFFDTDGYDSRIYAYENDPAYSFSIPAFSGKGWRYYALFNYDVSKKITLWLRWAHTLFSSVSNNDEESLQQSREWKLQLRWIF